MRCNVWIRPALLWKIGVCLLVLTLSGTAYADDASVLPKGTWRFYIENQLYLPIKERFNKDGHAEDVAKDFNVDLNSSVFADLALVEAAFFLPPGTGSLGNSVVSFKWDIKQLYLSPAYGLTDRLSVGIIVPYLWQKNAVSANLDASTATLGINPGVPGNIAPLGFPGTSPPTTDDIQNLLVTQGFERIETWSEEGLGDIELGGRYQYFNSDPFLLAFTGGVRFPTGKVDDPDNLVDRGFGDGVYALLFRFQQDYIRQRSGITSQLGIPEPGSFLLNTTFRYDLLLPDQETLRVCDVHNPTCPDKDDVRRNLGDVVEAEVSGSVGLFKGLFFSPLYKYGHKFKDHYSGDKSLDYGALADETRYNEHILKATLSYSTLPLFLEKRFPVPFIASVTYRDRFAGDNNLFKSRYIGLVLQAYL